WVFVRGYLFAVRVEDERERRIREASGERHGSVGEVVVKAPMPGLIVAVPVQEGQPVRKGEKLVLLESMKMQNEIRAPRDGTVKAIRVRPGQSVEQNQILVVLS
ncbi:acetyl-CoA carboxylase biotin carboxyl carrier protein subunit, partial [Thermoflexus sp.]